MVTVLGCLASGAAPADAAAELGLDVLQDEVAGLRTRLVTLTRSTE